MDDLVTRLSEGWHPVVVSLRPERTIDALKDCIDRRYMHIKFTDTRGGTELGFRLDPEHSDLTGADYTNGTGAIRVAGTLALNYVKVRCVADVALADLAGKGRLEILQDAPAA